MKTSFSKFLELFNRRERLQILALLLLMLVGALLETFVVGIIYPFISILKRPEVIHEHKVLHWIYEVISIRSTNRFIIWAAAGLILVYIFKNSYMIFLAYVQSRFIYNKQAVFSRRLFTSYLYKPYTFHLQRNTAELIYKINDSVSKLFGGFLFFSLMFIIEIMTTAFILGILILMKPLPTILTGVVLIMIIIVFYRMFRKKMGELGKTRQLHGEQMIQWVNQGLGGIKEVKILGREDFFIKEYEKNSLLYAGAERNFQVINQLPRSFLETTCIVGMLLVVVLTMGRNGEFQTIIPTLSLFAVAAFRIIPSMGRIFNAATQIRYHSYSLDAVCNDMTLLDKAVNLKTSSASHSEKVISFDKAIELKNVYYQYPNAKKSVLNDISLTIPKQYSVGLIGPSGAGKTTIIDVIVGLLMPTRGEVLIDGKGIKDNLLNWQRTIGYIPQNIYLSDDTVRRNIAFGLADEKIDEDQVWSVLASAQLEGYVKSLPAGLDTFIGERGIRLSGGQRQRIGIARALYHNPEVLIMDEGTASLDNETEWEIMQAVKNLSGKKTLIIVAHRLGTVKSCDRLYFIRDGEVIDYGRYEELFDKSQDFKAMVMATEYK